MSNKDEKEEVVEIDQDEESYYGVGSFLWEVVKVFLWALVIIVPIRIFLFQPFFVQGASMDPNFADGDYLIVNEFGYKITNLLDEIGGPHLFTVNSFKELKRGDVVVFRYPKNPSQFFIKRIIGLPGEQVKIENGHPVIFNNENPDGLVLDERSYIPQGVPTNGALVTPLNGNQYFVMGDNRMYSSDSRAWGPVPKDDIVGKVLLRAWPLNKAEIL